MYDNSKGRRITMSKEAKYSALQIAEWFLNYNRKQMNEEDAEYITNLKLQKLLYYAQGCYLALTDNPLFKEDILAWEHGPVVNEVYQKYKINGARGIQYDEKFCENIDEQTQNILKQVYEVFGSYSAWALRNKTHQEAPWQKTIRNDIIDLGLIKKYFKGRYVK